MKKTLFPALAAALVLAACGTKTAEKAESASATVAQEVVSSDFLRLRTAYLRYAIPQKVCDALHIGAANVRIEGNNLLLFCSKDLNGQDPEQLGFGEIGITTPPVASFSLGLDITF